MPEKTAITGDTVLWFTIFHKAILQRDLGLVGPLTLTYYKFTAESALKAFLNRSTSGEVKGKKVDCLRAVCAGAMSCWKTKNSLEMWLWRTRTVV